MSIFERYLTLWVGLCILGGITLGKIAPNIAQTLDGMSINIHGAPVVSIPIAICLFLMMYPIMVKVDFAEVLKAGKSVRPVSLTLVINWCIKPFTMYVIAIFFLGFVFKGFIGTEAMDFVKIPFGLQLDIGANYGFGSVVLHNGIKNAPNTFMEKLFCRLYSAWCSSMYRNGSSLGLPG